MEFATILGNNIKAGPAIFGGHAPNSCVRQTPEVSQQEDTNYPASNLRVTIDWETRLSYIGSMQSRYGSMSQASLGNVE